MSSKNQRQRWYEMAADNNAAVKELRSLESLQAGDPSAMTTQSAEGLYQNMPSMKVEGEQTNPWEVALDERRRQWQMLKELFTGG